MCSVLANLLIVYLKCITSKMDHQFCHTDDKAKRFEINEQEAYNHVFNQNIGKRTVFRSIQQLNFTFSLPLANSLARYSL